MKFPGEYGEPVAAFHEGKEVKPTYLPRKQTCTPKELADELRKLAEVSRNRRSPDGWNDTYERGRAEGLEQAAQMVEDRLK